MKASSFDIHLCIGFYFQELKRKKHTQKVKQTNKEIQYQEFQKASRVYLQSLRVSHNSRCGVPNSTVKVTNILKELNFVTYFYIRGVVVVVVVSLIYSRHKSNDF